MYETNMYVPMMAYTSSFDLYSKYDLSNIDVVT